MMAITHLTTALAVGSIPLLMGMSCNYGTESMLYFGAVALGSIAVDIDEPFSAIGRKFLPVSAAIKSMFGHRTITHNLIVAVIGMTVALLMEYYILFGFFVGMTVHILGDGMTGSVRAYYPMKKQFYTLPKSMLFRVGSATEYMILALATSILMVEHWINIKGMML